MNVRSVAVLALLLAARSIGAQPSTTAAEVYRAEKAFADAFAKRDRAKFFSLVLDDAKFLSPLRTLNGKSEVVERWSRFFETPVPPFSWSPERVAVNAAGTIGSSSGPVFGAAGEQIANFASIWIKQSDGSWKILFDGPGGPAASIGPPEEGYVTADDGVRLHYRKAGDGPITLIVPLEFVTFDFFKQLGDVATVIAYDMRNRGRSDRVEKSETLTIQQDIKDLEAVRKHFKVEKFVPVGYSYLGLMIVLYAREHPDHVTRLVQLGPVPIKFGTEYPKELTNDDRDIGAPETDVARWQKMQSEGAAEKTPREFCEAQAAVFRYVLVGDPSHASRVKTACDLENEWPVNFARQLQYHFGSVKALTLTFDDVKTVNVPVLTIHGTKDRNAPYGAGREWAMKLPNARLVTIEGAAHQAWADDPATVFAAIREFLRGDWPINAEKVTRLTR